MIPGPAGPHVITQLLRWLKDKWPEPRQCAICDADNWSYGHFIQESIQLLDDLALEDLVDNPDDAQPAVTAYCAATCLTCAHTIFFNAHLIGVISTVQVEQRSGRVRVQALTTS
ncbi:MAG TPA: hypothetical protein VM345_00390 [Acidimicrobiales bacterium]|jgi:hypothetical protein|nr:hypothetical protein [Acidimicrobiales bacterium]